MSRSKHDGSKKVSPDQRKLVHAGSRTEGAERAVPASPLALSLRFQVYDDRAGNVSTTQLARHNATAKQIEQVRSRQPITLEFDDPESRRRAQGCLSTFGRCFLS